MLKLKKQQESTDSEDEFEVEDSKSEVQEEIVHQLSPEEIEKRELLEFIQMQEREATESHFLNDQLTVPAQFSKLQSKHFPLFSTVQRLIYMMDASLMNSFFTRDKQGNMIGMDSHLGWHSECANGDSS